MSLSHLKRRVQAGHAVWRAVSLSLPLIVAACTSQTASTDTAATAKPSASAKQLEIPLTPNPSADIQKQIAQNWNIGGFAGDPLAEAETVQIRAILGPDGTVLRTEVLNDRPNDPHYREVRDSAIRAIRMASPLKLPSGLSMPSVIFNFIPHD